MIPERVRYIWFDSTQPAYAYVQIKTALNEGTGVAYLPLVAHGMDDQAVAVRVRP